MTCVDDAVQVQRIIDDNPIFLAPMAGWTDAVFRSMCKQMGAGLTYTEMVSAQGLAHASLKTAEYLEVWPAEGRVAVQLFGSEPKVMAQQAARLCDEMASKLVALDVNMGCPARKVVRKGEGSALMQQPQLAAQIVSEMVRVSCVPVTVKFRRGFERGNDTAVEFAKAMQQAGAAAMCVHGRYARDLYNGTADWGVVRRVKQAVQVPVIASGDLFSAQAIYNCMQQTGANAVMVARGAQGNPWIFEQTRQLMQKRAEGNFEWQPKAPTLEKRLQVMRQHVRLLNQRDPHCVLQMRSYFMPYFKGLPGASRLRGQVTQCTTLNDFEEFFDDIWSEACAHGYAQTIEEQQVDD